MKTLMGLLLGLTLSLSGMAQASVYAPGSRAEFEIGALKVKLSQDGTGIIKDVSCGHCDFNFVKITLNTQAYVNGEKVDISRVAGRAGKDVFIVFNAKTAEVQAIRWRE